MPPYEQGTFKRQYPWGVACDFNNILAACIQISELLITCLPEKDPIRKDIEGKKRAVDLIRPLFSSHDPQNSPQQYIDLNFVIREVEPLLRRVMGDNIELAILTSPDLNLIRADNEQMEQILLTLAVNAKDTMHRGGRIVLETKNAILGESHRQEENLSIATGEYVLLKVTYTIGTAPKGCLPGTFPNTDHPETDIPTNVLGFSTIIRTVKFHQGDITIERFEDRRTILKMYFPRIRIQMDRSCDHQGIPRQGFDKALHVHDE
jgi:two-component system cell cycle sensor histidine kinase/response regulator CckA